MWPKGYIPPFSAVGRGGGGEGRAKRFLTDTAQQLAHQTRHNFPISKDILFCPNLLASKNLPKLKSRYFEEQIPWVPH